MKMNRSLAVGVIVLSLVLAAAVAAVLRGPANAKRDAAPEVAYTLLDGRQGTLRALRGKVVLVSFWSMNCDTCVNEMPSIVATDGKFRSKGYETLAVAMSYDPPASVARFVAYNKLPPGGPGQRWEDCEVVRRGAADTDGLSPRQARPDRRALCRRAGFRGTASPDRITVGRAGLKVGGHT
jgi:thiol-disulfide isomerase/thioredoxin